MKGHRIQVEIRGKGKRPTTTTVNTGLCHGYVPPAPNQPVALTMAELREQRRNDALRAEASYSAVGSDGSCLRAAMGQRLRAFRSR